MINRRNIRVKVMQSLYTLITLDSRVKNEMALQLLQQHFEQTRALLIYLIYFFTELAGYAEKDAIHRAGKHIRTEEDLHVNIKIAGNEILLKIRQDDALRQQILQQKPENFLDRELVKKMYQQLVDLPEYKSYISEPGRNRNSEKKMLEFILLSLMLSNEPFLRHMEDNFSNWDDDGEIIFQLVIAYINKPGSFDFTHLITPDKIQFAEELLHAVIEKQDLLESMIIPRLKNWDPERIALLDMILMKMGVAEFLFFETIPPKVTINEYIDLAKDYSTTQSGQFVNGILDNIHKELVEQGKMVKVDFKKSGNLKSP